MSKRTQKVDGAGACVAKVQAHMKAAIEVASSGILALLILADSFWLVSIAPVWRVQVTKARRKVSMNCT